MNQNQPIASESLACEGSSAISKTEHAHEMDHDGEQRVNAMVRFWNVVGVVLPFAGLICGVILLWGRGFSWFYLGLILGMYLVTALGLTVGFHRLFTHRSFETNGFVKAILGICGSMAVEGPLLRWVAQHRLHHQHSDREGDPHSPHAHGEGTLEIFKGMWHAHIGWIFEPDAPNLPSYVGDLRKQRLVRTISGLFPLWVIVGLAIPTVLGGLITMSWKGTLLGFIWGGPARIFLVHHVTWSINSVCHIWGTRPFKSHDQSRNNFIFGVVGLGEGWHNNHHAFPTSAKHGFRWWQIDTSYWVILLLQWCNLASKVRTPVAEAFAAKNKTGSELTGISR